MRMWDKSSQMNNCIEFAIFYYLQRLLDRSIMHSNDENFISICEWYIIIIIIKLLLFGNLVIDN